MPNVTFYPSYIKAMKTLQPNEQLQLFWAITNRTLGEADFPMDEKISGMFALIEPIIESNRKRFENGKKGGEFGKLGGRPKKQTAQRKNTEKSASPEEFGGSCCRNPTGVYGVKPSESPDTDTDTDIDTDIDADRDRDGAKTARTNRIKEKKPVKKIDFGAVMDDFNRICVSLPAVKCLTDERKKAVRARSAEHGAESLREVFEKAENSDFLCGRNPTNATISGYRGTRTSGEPWRASFDWLLNKANFVKVLEGNYEPKPYERSDLDDYFDSIKCKT